LQEVAVRKVGLILLAVAGLLLVAGVTVIWTTDYGAPAKPTKAQLGCKGLASACEAYSLNPKSGGKYPRTLNDLMSPPSGGGSLLKNGQRDLIDPWGKPYTYALRTMPDGEQVPFIFTTTPDGIAISQYGVGPAAQPPQP
jgi:hypothetical protein